MSGKHANRRTPQRTPREIPENHLTLSEVLANTEVPDNWDLILIGDGSGNNWDQGCGFACTIIERTSGMRKLVHGGVNVGTVNMAELSAYLFGLMWYDCKYGQRARQIKGNLLNTYLITDSQTLVGQWHKLNDPDVAPDILANSPMWATMVHLRRQGYNLNFLWIKRLSIALNWAADQLAGKSRKVISEHVRLTVGPADADSPAVSIYDINRSSEGEVK